MCAFSEGREGGRKTELERRGERGEGGLRGNFLIIHVLILNILGFLCNIFPVFNARSCFNEFL